MKAAENRALEFGINTSTSKLKRPLMEVNEMSMLMIRNYGLGIRASMYEIAILEELVCEVERILGL